MITLTINGKKVKTEENQTLLEVCRKRSIPIPTLCHHPDLTPHGSCRLCTVEVTQNGKTRMVTACNHPVREGIRVETHSQKVLETRRILVELLLARCPQAPFVQAFARELGIEKTPFKTENPQQDCILCGLCVRTCNEIVGSNAIGFSRRGTEKRIGTPFEIDSERCIACGACEYICPTGAVKMEMERIRKIKQSDTGTLRACRYMRLGLVDFMVCSNGFECWRCELDQAMEDRFKVHPAFAVKPAMSKEPFQVSGFTCFPDYFYSDEHLWAKPMDLLIRLGLDDLISVLAMEADSILLPPAGSQLEKKKALAEITANGNKVILYSPLSGKVSAVNRDVEEAPGLAWRDPYRRGWLLMIEPDHPQEIFHLYSGESARAWFTHQAMDLAVLFKLKGDPLSMDESSKNQWMRKFVRDHRNDFLKILMKDKRDAIR